MTNSNPVISCKNVWKLFGFSPEKYLKNLPENKSYEEIQADGYIAGVKDVSVDVFKGEMLVIMGLSGSGKSTLLRCMSRLHDITGGTIAIDDQDIMSLEEKELIELRRNKMGMVFQSFGLLPHRSVLENVAFPLEMRGQNKHDRRDRALEVIKLVGLEGREDYFPRELSGGQQQRVGIARSLAIEPDIWFLDEPFSALDPLIRSDMQEILLELQEELHKTIVFITHDLDEALRIGDDIAILRDGRLVQQGSSQDIVLNPADDYVGDFIKDINRARVLTLGTLPLKKASTKGIALSNNTSLENAMKALVDAKKDSVIVVKGDKKLGSVSMHDIVHAATRSSETAGEAVTYR